MRTDNILIKICLLVLIINPIITNPSVYLEFIGHEGLKKQKNKKCTLEHLWTKINGDKTTRGRGTS